MKQTVYWEKVSAQWWSSAAGYVQEADGAWTGYVYRNLRNGAAWTEHKPGFTSSAAARQWVESVAEE